jgi:hypothetical protein
MPIKINKKGDGFIPATKSIFWLFAMIFSLFGIITLVVFFSIYQGQLVDMPRELEAETIVLRFVNNPDCFTYQDPVTNRVYPGVIDVEKYNQDYLDKCYYTEESKGYETYNFGFLLESFNPIDDQGEEVLLRTNNFFNNVDFTIYKSVIVRSGETLTPTTLIIYVQSKI